VPIIDYISITPRIETSARGTTNGYLVNDEQATEIMAVTSCSSAQTSTTKTRFSISMSTMVSGEYYLAKFNHEL
jgi:hypothetical protein